MELRSYSESVEWLSQVIRHLPSDENVRNGTPGYNRYNTQKDHGLGWLDPSAGTGTYRRRASKDRNGRYVYNHIVEPKMLLWLISAAGVDPRLCDAAKQSTDSAATLAAKAANIRKHVPWPVVAAALSKHAVAAA